MTSDGELLVMPPNFTLTGIRNREIISQLDRWAQQDGRGIVGEASTGFVPPNGARRSPDACWIANSDIKGLTDLAMNRYWPLCPAFIIELRSHSDRPRIVREKMQEWIANGAQVA